MDRELRFPRTQAFDRDYWLCRCEGFRVESGDRRLGVVEGVRYRRFHDRPDQLVVRGGLLGTRVAAVPIEDVLEIDPPQLLVRVRATAPARGTRRLVDDLLSRALYPRRAAERRSLTTG